MSLGGRVALQSTAFFVAMGLLLFLPAGTLCYVHAWIFLGVLAAITTAISLYLAKNDPKLLERRLALAERGEQQTTQRVLQALAGVSFFGILVVSGLDHRYHWSSVSVPWVVTGYVLLGLGYWIVLRVFRENTFTSALIEIAEGQTVVSTGPYAVVRHPMYSGGILAIAGGPLALGSWVACVLVAPLVFVIVARLLDEERFLSKQLAGYTDYMAKTRYRLIPRVW